MRYIFAVSLSIGKGNFILIHTQTMSSGIFSRQILDIYMMHVDTLIHTYITLHYIALHCITLHTCIHTYIFMKSLYEFVRTYEHKHTHTHC